MGELLLRTKPDCVHLEIETENDGPSLEYDLVVCRWPDKGVTEGDVSPDGLRLSGTRLRGLPTTFPDRRNPGHPVRTSERCW